MFIIVQIKNPIYTESHVPIQIAHAPYEFDWQRTSQVNRVGTVFLFAPNDASQGTLEFCTRKTVNHEFVEQFGDATTIRPQMLEYWTAILIDCEYKMDHANCIVGDLNYDNEACLAIESIELNEQEEELQKSRKVRRIDERIQELQREIELLQLEKSTNYVEQEYCQRCYKMIQEQCENEQTIYVALSEQTHDAHQLRGMDRRICNEACQWRNCKIHLLQIVSNEYDPSQFVTVDEVQVQCYDAKRLRLVHTEQVSGDNEFFRVYHYIAWCLVIN